MVTPEQVAAAPPAALGGTLVDGKWALAAYTVFTGPGGQALSLGDLDCTGGVLMISGTTIESATGSNSEGQPDTPRTDTETVTVSGTSLSVQATCPCASPSEPSPSKRGVG